MTTGKYVPYRAPFVPQSNQELPFDPNDSPVPYSPQELDSRQDVMNSQQRLQDALGNQAQANQPPSGIGGILQSPIFQAAVPTALTALSAIFPRHMAVAGPTGMAGFRTLNDAMMMQNRQRQTVASDIAKQSQTDFERQRFKYVVDHSDVDPTLATGIKQQADVDLPAAAKALQTSAEQSMQANAFGKATEAFDPKTSLAPGEHVSFTNPLTKETRSYTGEQPSEYADFASGDPLKQQRAKAFMDLKKEQQESAYKDFVSGDPAKRAAAVQYMTTAANLARENTQADAKTTLAGIKAGLIPPPLVSARGGMSKEMAALFNEASNEGYDLKSKMQEFMGQVQLTKTMNGQQWQGELKNIRATEYMIDNAKKLYNDWAPYATQFRTVNDFLKWGSEHAGTQAGVAAAKLQAATIELRRTMAQVLSSGNAVTDSAQKAAQDIVDMSMPPDQFMGVLDVANSMTGSRKMALLNPEPMVPGSTGVTQDMQHPEPSTKANPGGVPEPGKPASSGKYKTKADLATAVSKGELSIPAAKAYKKAHPELQ